MCEARVAAALVIIFHPPHTSKVELKAVGHEGNTVRGLCGLAEVQYQLLQLPLGAVSICFQAISLFPFLKVCDTCS